jgi:hypothetical protein
VIGQLQTSTGSFFSGILAVATALELAAVLALFVRADDELGPVHFTDP